LNRDKDNKVYDPKGFGLVVYDEGHSITANEAGKAVGKFEEALQLAVTATLDYSDTIEPWVSRLTFLARISAEI
jgi:superfamily II DNA or RNA helicase